MPNDVYPDDYFPRVVKPTPIHSTTQSRHNNPSGSSFTNRQLPASPQARSPADENMDSLQNLYFQKLLLSPDQSNNSPTEDMSLNHEDSREVSRSPSGEELIATGTDGDLNFNTRSGPISNKSMQDKQIISSANAQPKIVPWYCRFCTYKNKKAERVCDMCSKSKDFFEEEEEDEENEADEVASAPPPVPTPPVPKLYSQSNPKASNNATPTLILKDPSNMVECSHCTLLNPMCLYVCSACENPLQTKKSNTYI